MFMLIKPHTNYDFMGTRRFWATVSWLAAAAAVVLFFVKGLNYGIDFTGGLEINVRFNDAKVNSQTVRDVMKEVRSGDIQVQKFGDTDRNEYLIRFEGAEAGLSQLSKDIETKLGSKFKKNEFEIRKIDVVGPKVGQELKMSGVYSLLYALLGILIYVAIRFDYKFAPAAVIATVHDVIIIIGVFAITRYQFTLSTVAALLTIIGYSVNDTIVVFDRIRESMEKQKGTPLINIINRAINDTLSRTILTSSVTMLVVIMLLIYGGGTLWDFSFALAVGIAVGTYSSIFVAPPIVLWIDTMVEKKKAAQHNSK